MAATQADIANLLQAITALTGAMANPPPVQVNVPPGAINIPAAPLAAPAVPRNYATKPEAYDGSSTAFRSFMTAASIYVNSIPQTPDQIIAVLSFLSGHAAQWGGLYWQDNNIAIRAGQVSWQQFVSSMVERFADPRHEEKARAALLAKRLKEGDDIRNWIVELEELRIDGGLTGAAHDRLLVEKLIRQIPTSLAMQLESTFLAEQESTLRDIDFRAGQTIDVDNPTWVTYNILLATNPHPGVDLNAYRTATGNNNLQQQDYQTALNAHNNTTALLAAQQPTITVELLPAAQAILQREAAKAPMSYDRFKNLLLRHAPLFDRMYKDHQRTPQARFQKATPPFQAASASPAAAAPAVTPRMSSTQPAAGPAYHGPAPMDIGRTQGRETRTCYRCNQVGHLSRNCPQKSAKERVRAIIAESDDSIQEVEALLAEMKVAAASGTSNAPGFQESQ
jgi:Zinc knuckle